MVCFLQILHVYYKQLCVNKYIRAHTCMQENSVEIFSSKNIDFVFQTYHVDSELSSIFFFFQIVLLNIKRNKVDNNYNWRAINLC